MARKHEVGTTQLVGGDEQSPQERGGHRERRVRDHPERTPGQPQITRVCLHDDHGRVAKPLAKHLRPSGMQLDGNDARAAFDQRRSDRARSGADIDDKITRADARVVDELNRGVVSEPMPSPAGARPAGGHDAPSQSSSGGSLHRAGHWCERFTGASPLSVAGFGSATGGAE